MYLKNLLFQKILSYMKMMVKEVNGLILRMNYHMKMTVMMKAM
jgi:hypothetical protein